MAEESDYSRTEPASERRLALARAEGRVPRSQELSALLVLGVMAAGLALWGAQLFHSLQQLFAEHFRTVAQASPEAAFSFIQLVVIEIIPFLSGLLVAALLAPLLLSGWVFAPGVMEFRAERLSPWSAFTRLFSATGLFDGFKALLKITVLGLLLFGFYRANLDAFAALLALPLQQAVAAAGNLLLKGFLLLLAVLLLSALLDAPWQWWRYLKGLAMTRAEVLAEVREAEGSPELKARIRARQQRMRQEAAE